MYKYMQFKHLVKGSGSIDMDFDHFKTIYKNKIV